MTIKELITALIRLDPMTAVFIGREIDGADEFSKLLATQTGAWEIQDNAGGFTVWADADLAENFAPNVAEDMRRQNPAVLLIGEDL